MPPTPGAAYRRVLATPGAAGFVAAGALARLPTAMVGLGSVLMLTGLGRSYGLAGAVAGAIALAQSAGGPRAGRLADRLGQARVIVPLLALHLAALGALVLAAKADGPGWLLLAAGAAAGATLPQVGAFARARWTVLVRDPARLRTALAVESLIEEAAFVAGPLVVTLLATGLFPAAGLLTAMALSTAGCLAFAAQRDTEPPPRGAPAGAAAARGALRHPGLAVVVIAFFAVGAMFGLIEVAVVALAREHGRPAAAGPMLAVWAGTSLVAGTAFGAVAWAGSPRRRFAAGAGGLLAGTVLVGAAASGPLAVVAAALALAGVANAPTLIAGNALVPEVVPAGEVTEAYTWLNVIVFAGIAAGSTASGLVVDAAGPEAALRTAVLAAGAALSAAALGRRALVPSRA